MSAYSIKVYPLKRQKKDGSFPIFIRIYINSNKKEIYLNFSIKDLKDFDDSKERIRSNVFNASNYNLIISNNIQKLRQYFLDCEYKNIQPSIFGLENFINNKTSSDDFFDFAEQVLIEIKGIVTSESLRQFKSEISKLKKFKTKLQISDIDLTFVRSYEQYMRTELQNKTNTVTKTLKKIKRFMNIAIEKELIEKNPMDNYKFKSEKTNRTFLSMEELGNLEIMFHNPLTNVKLKNVLQWFLFSCYTGLRYSDLYNLKWENIENNKINIIQEKTDESVYVPLIDKALLLLPKTDIKTGKIFKIYTNQKCNEYLKIIAMSVGIKKHLTFHSSRHTFATVSLNLGIRFEVVSKLLGHSDLKTTKIYARLLNETTDNEMLKWNKY